MLFVPVSPSKGAGPKSSVLSYVKVPMLAGPSRGCARFLTMTFESHPEVRRLGASRSIQPRRACNMIKATW